MRKGAPVVFTALVLLVVAPRAEASQFDGTWQATSPAQSMQCPGVNARLTVRGNGVGGTVGVAKFTYGFRGPLASDGSFDIKSPGGTAHIAGKFSGDDLSFDFNNDQCPVPRHLEGKKTG
jgi:hypothetical protein